ncbi:MAG: 23S rRNA (uracil(1939)-C(5))-methyltransferase RlmD [Prevotellaceae bacterium]|jgi:23S rRNA (uracil1939-C5)-methyltransferase|nr:23S rRNA (uracil(1939)-C(5))-methyltransferase RlmD [Prevotellaceae bacterium]
MAREYPTYNNIEITDIAAEGKAIGRYEGKVVFVPYAVPGDVLNVQVLKNRQDYAEGIIKNIVTPSPQRMAPFCSHFGTCGGCKWQVLPYSMQLACKQQQVFDQLSRIGKLTDLNIQPILPAKETLYYRNKLEFTFSDKRWLTDDEIAGGNPVEQHCGLGFHIPGMFDKVLDIEACYLQPNPSNDIRLAVKQYALTHRLPFFNLRDQTGFLRTLIIRNAVSSGEVMVIVVLAHDDKKHRNALLKHLQQQFPDITSLFYVINGKRNDTIHDLDVNLFAGRSYMEEQLDDLTFKISPKSFFQTNSKQALRLYHTVRDFAGLTGRETVYDLYTGTGSIALFLARQAAQVVGVEMTEDAITDAQQNAARNRIFNTKFYVGDMKDLFKPEFIAANGRPDVIVLDPPRAGIHPDVAGNILESGAQRLVYVSCNPATQARDLAWLSSHYHITRVQPVDMFPHTHHVENIVLAEKNI